MANEKILNTRILMKTDTLENWNNSTLGLKKGELAFATVAATAGNGLAEPVVMVKIGEDGVKTFKDLPWNFYAKASDVIAEAKSADTLETFVKNVIANAGIASDETMQALAERVTAAEGEIDTLQTEMDAVEAKAAANETTIAALQGKVGDESVIDQITAEIAKLNLADTYAAKVHGHEMTEVNGLSDAIAAAKKAGTDANAALEAYKTLNDAAVKVNSDAIAAIKNGETLDNFKEVEEALAGKQAAGDYSVVGHKHEIADVNGLSDAIADAKKAGTDAATAAGQALTDAKDYTDAEMARLVGDTKVSDQIDAKITALDLDNTYDAKGAAAAAETAAKGHADDLNAAMNTRVEALEAIDHDHANKAVLDGITAEKVTAWDAAEQNAKDHADELDEAMAARVLALEGKLGTGEGNVDAQIAAAVAAEKAEREAADAGLLAQIEANDADILALQGLVGDTNVAEAIKAEEERAKAAEKANADAIKAISDDYLKAADAEALQNQINTIMNNPDAEGAINSINEFTAYVAEHGTIADGMRTDINKNKDDIAAEKQRAEGVEGGLDTRLQAVEAAVGADGAVAKDIEAALGEAKGYTDALAEGAVADNAAAIEALQTKVGDTSVQDQINAALKVDGVDKYALATDLAATNEEVAKKANDAELAAIAKTGSTDDLVQGTMTLVFDCGGASV